MSEPSPTGNGGNEWLKPVDPNEGERKWAQYVAATTPPRALHLPASGLATPQFTPQRLECPPPAAIDTVLISAPLPVSSATPPKSPEPCGLTTDSLPSAQPQLFAQVDGKFVPVVVRSDGSVSHRTLESEPSLGHAGKRPQPVSYPVLPSAGVFESQNAWILLHQQQQLLFQLQQQQAVTAAALAGIAAKAVSPAADISWFVPQQPTKVAECDLAQQAVCQPSEPGLSTPHSSTVTPTVDSTKGGTSSGTTNGGRNARQEALLQQLRQTTITLPPPPPPPAPEKPFLFKRKSKSQSLEALMNSLQYTDLLTPSYSNKDQTQSETGVVVEALEDSSPIDAETPQLGSTATPSALPVAPGYKKKPCRAFQSAGGCRHGEKCLFSHTMQQ